MSHAVRPTLIASVLVATVLLAACAGSRTPSTAAAPASEQDPARLLVMRVQGEQRMATTPAAAAGWRAAIELATDEGRCTRRPMQEPGVIAYTLQTTNPDESNNATTLIVDATGRVVRYSDARGTPRVIIRETGLTPAQRDSAVRVQLTDGPRTVISVDYITGMATANNRGGDASGMAAAVQGSAALFDTLPNMGPPSARIAVIRARCGAK
jgi:hypothetical protein